MPATSEEKLKDLLQGKIVCFGITEVMNILAFQSELNINTLGIQKADSNKYYCKVDRVTVDFYKKRSRLIQTTSLLFLLLYSYTGAGSEASR